MKYPGLFRGVFLRIIAHTNYSSGAWKSRTASAAVTTLKTSSSKLGLYIVSPFAKSPASTYLKPKNKFSSFIVMVGEE